MKTIIGLSGKARSGKDSFIQALTGNNYIVRGFADSLKEECAEFCTKLIDLKVATDTIDGYENLREFLAYLNLGPVLDQDGSELFMDWYVNDFQPIQCTCGTKRHDLGTWVKIFNDPILKPAFRKLMQWWGTEYRRNLFGESYWVDQMSKFIDSIPEDSVLFINDVRFLNEASFVKSHGGTLIRIVRPGIFSGSHPSETSLDDYPGFDFVVQNVGTLEDLQASVLSVYARIKISQNFKKHFTYEGDNK